MLLCRKQLQGSLKFILGFPTIASTFGLAVAMQLVGITATSWRPDTALQVLLQLLMLAVLADFGLYWGEPMATAAAAGLQATHCDRRRLQGGRTPPQELRMGQAKVLFCVVLCWQVTECSTSLPSSGSSTPSTTQ